MVSGRVIWFLAATSMMASGSMLHAQSVPHRVRLAPRAEAKRDGAGPWYARSLQTVIGTVVQFDENQISIMINDEAVPTRFASYRVLRVELAAVPQDQQTAIEAFREKEYSKALPALIRAVSERDAGSRPPVWRQQWLSMLAAQAAMRTRRGEIALELVEQLDARPLPAMILGVLPIDWTGRIGDEAAMVEIAVERAKSKSVAVKLVAASWLLRSPKYRSAATAALKRLAQQKDRKWVALLAGQLIWRTKPPPEIQPGLTKWEDEITRLPMALQAGPMVSLLQTVRQTGLDDAERKWQMIVELAAPTWHPDLD